MCPSRLCSGLGAMSNVDRVEVWRTLQQIAACISVHMKLYFIVTKKHAEKNVSEGSGGRGRPWRLGDALFHPLKPRDPHVAAPLLDGSTVPGD